MSKFPVELAVTEVLHRAAAGGTLGDLLDGVAQAGVQAMGPGVARAAVVLDDPAVGLVVRASASGGSAGRPGDPAVRGSDELVLTGPVVTTVRSGAATAVLDTAAGRTVRWTRGSS